MNTTIKLLSAISWSNVIFYSKSNNTNSETGVLVSATTAGSSTASARTWSSLKVTQLRRCTSATGLIMKRWCRRSLGKI